MVPRACPSRNELPGPFDVHCFHGDRRRRSPFGSEIDLVVNYAATAFLTFQAGYSHFFLGDYVRQSVDSVPTNGGTVDADYVYVMTTFRF
jgi:hypothetical protein